MEERRLMGDEVFFGGCIVVEGELVGFLKGYRNYTRYNKYERCKRIFILWR